jgi:hypothetical protein
MGGSPEEGIECLKWPLETNISPGLHGLTIELANIRCMAYANCRCLQGSPGLHILVYVESMLSAFQRAQLVTNIAVQVHWIGVYHA